MSSSFTHPQTTASRRPGCTCGSPMLRLLPDVSPLLFRAACCFAQYQLIQPETSGGAVVLALVKEGPEELGPGICDACGGVSLHLYAFDSAPAAGLCLCRACLEGPETASF
jgi:hypothetical protein